MKYYFLWCDKCRGYTKHKVEDDTAKKIQTITCTECNTFQEDEILHERVKVSSVLWGVFNDYRQRNNGEKTTSD